MVWFTYIVKCADESYYVGHTENIQQRLDIHNAGKGAQYTKVRRPVTLVYSETFDLKSDAIAREKQLKKWSKAKKCALIEGNLEALHQLARRRV